MKKYLKVIFFIWVCSGNSLISVAQSDCSDALYSINKLYFEGKIQSAIDRTKHCMTAFRTKEERFEAYRILSNCYLALKDYEKVNYCIKRLLKIRPNYTERSLGNENLELVKLIKSYSVKPDLFLGVCAGFSINRPFVISNRSPYTDARSEYKSSPGYLIGIEGLKDLPGNWEIAIRMFQSGSSIQHDISGLNLKDINYFERYDFTNLALAPFYHFKLKRDLTILPFIQLGAGYLNRSYSVLSYEDIQSGQVEQKSYSEPEKRNRIQLSAAAGFEFRKKMDIGNIGLQFSYSSYLTQFHSKKEASNELSIALDNGYFSDKLRLQSWAFEFKYSYPIRYLIEKK
ncbi:MAG: hypothetical protein H6605_09355 [Flavobacteriales bacterium]|nr:hypothetical protein [Flavobacteriales bacterium]